MNLDRDAIKAAVRAKVIELAKTWIPADPMPG